MAEFQGREDDSEMYTLECEFSRFLVRLEGTVEPQGLQGQHTAPT